MMDGWSMTGWGWAWMSLGSVVSLAVIALVVWALTRDAGPRTARPGADPALEALRRRFAAGEIDEDEFNRRRAALDRRS